MPRPTRFEWRILAIAFTAMAAAACQSGHIHDPNNPAEASSEQLATVLRRNIVTAADNFNNHVLSGDISDSQRKALLARRARDLLKIGDPQAAPPKDKWIYADLEITAGDWQAAIPLLREAVQYATEAKDDDRRVNDSLRLARALAETGKVKDGLDLAQKVIDSKPVDPGPVLPSVLLELSPIASGKGYDLELAHLLEEAVNLHMTMKVDPNSEAGKAFLVARPFHIRNAWRKIVGLYTSAGRTALAADAATKAETMMQQLETGRVRV